MLCRSRSYICDQRIWIQDFKVKADRWCLKPTWHGDGDVTDEWTLSLLIRKSSMQPPLETLFRYNYCITVFFVNLDTIRGNYTCEPIDNERPLQMGANFGYELRSMMLNDGELLKSELLNYWLLIHLDVGLAWPGNSNYSFSFSTLLG